MIKFIRLDHIQICIPAGKKNEARDFYSGVPGLEEIRKPSGLILNGGLWYKIADIQIHIGIENKTAVSKRHPSFEISDADSVRIYLEGRNVKINDEIQIPDIKRFSFNDPFGNRIELLQKI